MKYTPENITSLEPDEMFVFGSNAAGMHNGGAARTAVKLFGAEYGVGEGPQGQSYAIPTMGTFDELKAAVERFTDLAREWDQTTFYVTKIGCGIAGYSPEQIAPLFAEASHLYNVRLPREFAEIIARGDDGAPTAPCDHNSKP